MRRGVVFPTPGRMALFDNRWSRGGLERFGPRVSLTGASAQALPSQVRRAPLATSAVLALPNRREFHRFLLFPTLAEPVAGAVGQVQSVAWFRRAPLWATFLWCSVALLFGMRQLALSEVTTAPVPLVRAVIMAGHAADQTADGLALAESSLRYAMRQVPDAGRVILGRLRTQVGGGPSWWTLVEVDGTTITASAEAGTIADALRDAGFTLDPDDRIVVMPHQGPPLRSLFGPGVVRAAEVALDGETPARTAPRAIVLGDAPLRAAPAILARLGQVIGEPDPSRDWGTRTGRIIVQRATPFRVTDDGFTEQARSLASTVGDALRSIGIELSQVDDVVPSREMPLLAGQRITIMRAPSVEVRDRDASGAIAPRSITVRTRTTTVAELLAEREIVLGDLDSVLPELGNAVPVGGVVRVLRGRDQIRTELEVIPFQTHVVRLPGMRGRSVVFRSGVDGLRRREIRERVVDGNPVAWSSEEFVERPAVHEIIAEPAVAISSLVPGAGLLGLDRLGSPLSLNVSRQISMIATAYDPGPESTGKSPGDPGYGVTASGLRFAPGIVAVDPSVIPFYTRVWVPGYGFGIAADTGSDIQGNRIDLGFATYWEAVQWGRRAVTVYILP